MNNTTLTNSSIFILTKNKFSVASFISTFFISFLVFLLLVFLYFLITDCYHDPCLRKDYKRKEKERQNIYEGLRLLEEARRA